MFKRILKAIQEGQQRRVHYWQLQNMSDRELRDIGVSRAEIRNKIYSRSNSEGNTYYLLIKIVKLVSSNEYATSARAK